MPRGEDIAWQEFLALCDQHGGPAFTKAVAEAVGLEAIATLRYQARRGNTAAAKYLCDRWLGEPLLPFEERAKQMTDPEVRDQLRTRYLARLRARGYGETEAGQIADDLALPPGDEGETDG